MFQVLGEALYYLRLPLMTEIQFTEEVARSGLLTHEEVANMYIGFNSSFDQVSSLSNNDHEVGGKDDNDDDDSDSDDLNDIDIGDDGVSDNFIMMVLVMTVVVVMVMMSMIMTVVVI